MVKLSGFKLNLDLSMVIRDTKGLKEAEIVQLGEDDGTTNFPVTDGKDLNERLHETSKTNEHTKRKINEDIKNSLNAIRKIHGIKIEFDKSGKKKLILEVPLQESEQHFVNNNESKWGHLRAPYDMTEVENHTKRTKKDPNTKKRSPRTFRKMTIQNYSRPMDESNEVENDASDDIHESTINSFLDNNDHHLTMSSSDETQYNPRYYRRFDNDGKLSHMNFSHSNRQKNGETENTDLLSREPGKPYSVETKIVLKFK